MIRKISENFHWLAFGIYTIGFGILDSLQIIAVDDNDSVTMFDFITGVDFGIIAAIVGVATLLCFWPYDNVTIRDRANRAQSLCVAVLLIIWVCITIGAIFNHGSSFLSVVGVTLILHILLRAYTD